MKLTKLQFLFSTLVLVLGVGLSITGSKFLFDYSQEQRNLWIKRNAESRAEELQLRINTSHDMLASVASFLNKSPAMDDEQFRLFIESIQHDQQGALLIAWAPRIRNEERKVFEKTTDGLLTEARYISEMNSHGLRVMAPVRDVYYPVKFVVTNHGKQFLTGLNIESLTRSKPYIQRAKQSGQLTTTRKITLHQQLPDRVLYQAICPVYEGGKGKPIGQDEEPIGFVLAVFDINLLINKVYAQENLLNLTILDADARDENQLIYTDLAESHPMFIKKLADLESYSAANWSRNFNVGDRRWLAIHTQKRPLPTPLRDWLPYLSLFLGILLTSILSIYLFLAHWRSMQLKSLKGELKGMEKRLTNEQQAVATQSAISQRLMNESEEKTRFIHAFGHDLRQPLNSMGLYLEQLQFGDKQQEQLNKLKVCYHSLSRMMEVLLDKVRLEAGLIKPELEKVDLQQLLHNLHDEFEQTARNKQISLSYRCPPLVTLSDPVLLERMIRNLLNNAIHYTDHGKVLLGARKKGDQATIYVMDTGKGIAKENMNRLFEPYVRGDKQKHTDGMGLGLSIVKQTGELLDHKLECHSEVNKGSCFRIILPLVPEPVGRTVPVQIPLESEEMDLEKILLVDDDFGSLQAMHTLLSAWDYKVVTCEDMDEARLALDSNQDIDLIITDYNLPGGNGVELIINARQQMASSIPAIVITGESDDNIQFIVEEQDCFYLQKPVQAKKLQSFLKQCQRKGQEVYN